MSRKFNLVQDRDNDRVIGSIKRHVIALATLLIVAVAVIVLVLGSSIFGIVKGQMDRQQEREQAASARATVGAIRAENALILRLPSPLTKSLLPPRPPKNTLRWRRQRRLQPL